MPFQNFSFGRTTEIHPLSNGEGLRTNGYKMTDHGTRHKKMKFWETIAIVLSYLVHYNNLLQNATDIITKCDSYFITKCDKSLLQDASAVLLKHAAVITKCDIYYEIRQYMYQFTMKLLYTFQFAVNSQIHIKKLGRKRLKTLI